MNNAVSRPNNEKNWTEIEISVGDEPNNNDALKLTLDDSAEEDQTSEQQEGQDNRGQPPRPSTQTKAPQNNQDDSEGETDQEERTPGQEPPRQVNTKIPRAEKRIRTLLGVNKEQDKELQILRSQIDALKKQSKVAETASVRSQKDQWKTTVEDKQNQLEQAVRDNDPKAQAKIIRELADANVKLNAYEAVHNELENEPDPEPTRSRQPYQQPLEEIPDATMDWVEKNSWFRTDRKLHLLAREVVRELIEEGEDPRKPEFYTEVDSRLKETGVKLPGAVSEAQERKDQRRRAGPVTQSADESDGDSPGVRRGSQFTRVGNKINATATEDDKQMARDLNVDLNKYLKEKYKYEQQGYKGYVEVDVGR